MDPTLQYGAEGAALGTAILPGWGTAIGAGAGALLGGAEDLFGGGGSSGPTPQQKAQAAYAAYAAHQYQQNQQQVQAQMAQLQAIQSGRNSVSAEQLRQGLQQNVAAQQSMAAGAAPQNQVMAARTAMMQAGRLGAGLAGQQAVAGLQERQQASQLAAQLAEQMRQQSLQATLGGQGGALNAYTVAAGNSIKNPTGAQNVGNAIQGGATIAALA